MAPRGATKPKPNDKGPDGAPPGAEAPRTDADKHAFDADGHAKARETAPVTIGDTVYHRRRRNWAVSREMRGLLRQQERAGGRAARLRARVDALTEQIRGVQDPQTGEWKQMPVSDEAEIERIESEVDEFDSQIDLAADEADDAVYALISLLLRKDDTDEGPSVDALKEALDIQDAGDLAATLAGGQEPDPTQSEPTSS